MCVYVITNYSTQIGVGNAFENVFKVSSILSRPQCAKLSSWDMLECNRLSRCRYMLFTVVWLFYTLRSNGTNSYHKIDQMHFICRHWQQKGNWSRDTPFLCHIYIYIYRERERERERGGEREREHRGKEFLRHIYIEGESRQCIRHI